MYRYNAAKKNNLHETYNYVRPGKFKYPEAACELVPRKKRPLAGGLNVQQNVWKPTARKINFSYLPTPGKPDFKLLPPLLGPKIVDSTKKSGPAYTFGHVFKKPKTDIGEGPAKIDISGMHNKGTNNKRIHIAIKSRLPGLQRFSNPSAAEYILDPCYKMVYHTIPAPTFGKRPKPLKSFHTPAPNVYSLPPVVGTTKESNKKAAPAFTMLGKEKASRLIPFVYPGPGYYDFDDTVARKRAPKFSMRKQLKPPLGTNPPGPGTYCPEMFYKSKSVPAPSISIKHTPFMRVPQAHLIKPCQMPVIGLFK